MAREAHTFVEQSPISCDIFDPTKRLCLDWFRAMKCSRLQEE